VKAVVVGAGIGGLGAALACRRAGHEVAIVERAESLEPVGAGISLAPNAMSVLDRLDVADEIRRRGGVADRILVLNKRGGVLSAIDARGRAWEVVGVRRADLQDVLLDAVGATGLRLGVGCTGVEEHSDGVAALLDDGTAVEGDVLVGADGIRSTVRGQLKGDEPFRFAGYFGWRAAIEFSDPQLERRFSESWGAVYRVGLLAIGHGRLYWFVSERADEDEPMPTDPKTYFRERLSDWHAPIPDVVDATPDLALTRLPIHDRRPLGTWGEGRVTLLGDAAHPMTPNLGQGAAQALEDAVALADALNEADDPTDALRVYEQRRLPRTTLIVNRSWQLGRLAQLKSPVACRVRDALMRSTPARVQRRQQELVIGLGSG
jgi:2-polyprenyl-6-methoxyphenol hydroxylase-like FAD-dependent oxidoreductase